MALETFTWQGALLMGGVIGLIELFFVHADEKGLGWLSHGLHALPIAIVLTFISMNIDWFIVSVVNWQGYNGNIAIQAGLRTLVGLVAAFKVKSAAAVIQGHNSVGEKLGHALIIGILIATSPYIWAFILGTNVLPAWLSGVTPAPSR